MKVFWISEVTNRTSDEKYLLVTPPLHHVWPLLLELGAISRGDAPKLVRQQVGTRGVQLGDALRSQICRGADADRLIRPTEAPAIS